MIQPLILMEDLFIPLTNPPAFTLFHMYTNGNLEFSSQAENGAEESDVEGEDADDDSKVDPNEDPTASVDDDVHVRS